MHVKGTIHEIKRDIRRSKNDVFLSYLFGGFSVEVICGFSSRKQEGYCRRKTTNSSSLLRRERFKRAPL